MAYLPVRARLFAWLLSLLALAPLACAGRNAGPAAAPGQPAAAAGAAAGAPTEAPLPIDPKTRMRTLPNGLRYYLRRHQEPRQRAALRLAVNAGSVLETENERGLAHFVEHMAFNGTRLFKKQEMVDFMEKVGMRFGQHANASTSFDETIYTFDVPTDDPAVLEKGLLILQQIAADVSFDLEEVDRERKVLVEEWRIGRGAGLRMLEKILPVLFQGSRYAERLPIGKKQILEGATAQDLKQFYQRWYRPDLMAVTVVGDFDVDKVEQALTKLFGPKPRQQGPERPLYPVPDHQQTLVVEAKDKEMPSTSVGLYYKLPRRGTLTKADYRRYVVEAIYHGMMNGRLDELTRAADPPFLGAGSATQPLVRVKDVFMQLAATKQDGVVRGLEALTREVERVDRHGFTPGELDRAKTDLVRGLEQIVREQDKTPSGRYADEMVRHFLRQEAMPGIDAELALTKEFMPGVALPEMNRLASEWITERNRVIVVQGPEAAPVPPPGELLSLFERVQRENIGPYVDKVAEGPLLGSLPGGKPVKRTRELKEIGVNEWQLGNGVRVVLKPTDFKNDEILMTARSPGGHSLVSDKDYPSALYAADLVGASGVGRFGPTELRKALSGKVVNVGPLHQRAGRGPDRPRLARGPGDAAAAHLPVRDGPAGGRRGVRGVQGAAFRAGGPPPGRPADGVLGQVALAVFRGPPAPAPARPGAGGSDPAAGDGAAVPGPFRRRRRHDLRVRGPDRPGQAAAAGREVPGGAALAGPQGEVARRRGPPQRQRQALRDAGWGGAQGAGGHGVHHPGPLEPGAAAPHGFAERGAVHPPARGAARGHGWHLHHRGGRGSDPLAGDLRPRQRQFHLRSRQRRQAERRGGRGDAGRQDQGVRAELPGQGEGGSKTCAGGG